MGRPSNRDLRRQEIVLALERVLAGHGLGAASIAAVASEADLAPGLLHHHFRDKEELFEELVDSLHERFRSSTQHATLEEALNTALAIRDARGVRAARAWVGLFAEGVRSVAVADRVRRVLRREVERVRALLVDAGVSEEDAEWQSSGLVAFVIGALVFGAFMPRRANGFAAKFASSAARGIVNGTMKK